MSDTDKEDPKTPWWISTINRLGLPTALLCVILFMLWQGGVWTADNVAMPIVKKQVEFIDAALKANEKMASITSEIRDTLKHQKVHGDSAVQEFFKLSEKIDTNQKEAEARTALLEDAATSDRQSLEILKSIDTTLKSQQSLLKEITTDHK